jgi:proline iminopeptidase
MKQLLFTAAIIVIISCNRSQNKEQIVSISASSTTEIKAGGNKMIQIDGKYYVWTKKVGDGKIKVLLLHGGPGFTHDYMECMEDFLPKEGIEFYYYDLLGAGNSDNPADTSLWNLPRFVEEVEQVRERLGLENFYLFGHSWGGLLAMEYLHKYQSHVKAAVLSNMVAGIASYLSYAEQLKQKFFDANDIKKYDSLDKLKKYDSPEFQDLLMNKLYSHVMCQLKEWPEPVMRAFKKANTNIYIQMQGVDEFHVTGNLKYWEFWDKLKDINTPTLVIGGMNDEMNPEDMKREGLLIPNSRTYLCPNGSHMSMYDDQQNYFRELIKFLKDVEEGKFIPDKK